MKINIDSNKIANVLATLAILAGIKLFFEFNIVKAEVNKNVIRLIYHESRIDIIAFMLCRKEIKDNPKEAPDVCWELKAKYKKKTK